MFFGVILNCSTSAHNSREKLGNINCDKTIQMQLKICLKYKAKFFFLIKLYLCT
jgi:hypothetical protein